MASRRSYGTGSVFIHPTVQPPTWYGQWWTPDGRRPKRKIGLARQPGSREGLTRTQAEAKLRELMAEVRITPRASGERLDVEQVGRRYRLHIERKGRKRSTVQNVESEVRVHLAPFFAGRAMDAITTEDVIDLVLLLEEGKELAPKTIRNIVATLSALFNFAMQRRWAIANPCDGVELPAVPESGEIRFLTLDEVDLLVEHARPGEFQALDRAIFLTAAMTGLRKGELLALRWSDVDWTAGRVRVRQNYVRGEFGTPKSKRSTRSVPMADEVAGELDRLFRQSGWQGETTSCSPTRRPASHCRSRTSRAGCAPRSRPRSSTRRTASTICATRSGRGWPPRACRCARCRSGWATATSRRPSATPTTRRAPARPRWSPRRSHTPVAPFVAPI